MPVNDNYTNVVGHPFFRRLKRLAINLCVKEIRNCVGDDGAGIIYYVTLGGAYLWDVMDLITVFDLQSSNVNVVSYEMDEGNAITSKNCEVARIIKSTENITLQVVHDRFYSPSSALDAVRGAGIRLYFLDYKGVYSSDQAADIRILLKDNLLRQGDWLMITSSLDARCCRQDGYLEAKAKKMRLLYGLSESPDLKFRIRNNVDFHLAGAFQTEAKFGNKLHANRRKQIIYNDTGTDMELCLFQIESFVDNFPRRQDFEPQNFCEQYEGIKFEKRSGPNLLEGWP